MLGHTAVLTYDIEVPHREDGLSNRSATLSTKFEMSGDSDDPTIKSTYAMN